MQKSGLFQRIGLAICGKCTKIRVQGHEQGFKGSILITKTWFLCRMVLEWRKREHGDVEEAMQGDLMT